MKRAAIVLAVAWTSVAVAQPQPEPTAPPQPTAQPPAQPQPRKLDLASCVAIDTTPGVPTWPEPPGDQVATPIPWNEFSVEAQLGQLVDSPATLHAMLEPTLGRYATTLTAKTLRDELAKQLAKLGYQLVGYEVRNARLILHVETLPIIRKVEVDLPSESLFNKLFDEDLRRRMRLRVGAYLPFDPHDRDDASQATPQRQCALIEEQARLADYLVDEGNFDADVELTATVGKKDGVATVRVRAALGNVYELDYKHMAVRTTTGEPLPIATEEIREVFHHHLSGRFRTTQLREDLAKAKQLLQKKNYPAVRVQSSYDPKTSFDRHTKTVKVSLTIDLRRYLDIKFAGNDRDAVTDEQLRAQLTFDQAGSTDDVEAANSTRALVTYLQQRGFFDAHVTWTREPISDNADQITFHIEQGKTREVKSVTFVGNAKTGDLADARLAAAVATKRADATSQLFNITTAASSAQLAADLDRLRELYRRSGYREAQVGVDVSTDPTCANDLKACALGNAALTAAFVQAGVGDGLYVRFTIVPGPLTLLQHVVIEGADADAKALLAAGDNKPGPLCDPIVHELAAETSINKLARVTAPVCTASAPDTPFREDDMSATRDRLRDFLYKQGRPRAAIDYEARVVGPYRVEAHYTLHSVESRRVGKLVWRGNFKTRPWILERLLQLHEGDTLTSDALAAAARRVRNSSLFSAVNFELFDLDSDSPYVNGIVHVEERYDNLAQIDLEGGYSSYNGFFGTAIWTQSNLFGTGMSLILTGTLGQKITDAEATWRLPKWLSRSYLPFVLPFDPVEIQTDITALYRQQDTPRFGELTTIGASVAWAWIKQIPHIADQQAHDYSIGVHVDYRLRTRNVDALRPIGADTEDQQVAVSTETNSVGVTAEWEQRVDRRGLLAPLSAEAGFRLYGSVSYATPLLGDAEFVKVAASGTYFIPIPHAQNLTVRVDARYDQGFPLGGAVLLPDVERFFAGGDNTVRGYNDDAMATEIVQVGVPPLSNLTQIRVIPAGGDIRLLGSIDAQYRAFRTPYGDLAGAAFSDQGVIANEWTAVKWDSVRPSVGSGLRFLTPFGALALEYAVPLNPHLGDDPRGRIHLYFAARAQF